MFPGPAVTLGGLAACLALVAAGPVPAAGASAPDAGSPAAPIPFPPSVAPGAVQQTPDPDPAAPPGSSLRIYLLTAEPGDAVWERFGHNALRIVDEAAGTDVSWNWGLFSFDQEGFVLRLIRGTMLYWMGGFPTDATLQEYRATDRAVWSQELDLTPAQKRAVQAAVLENDRPENRYYRYDYYRDNCSTRIRDILDAALGGRIRAATGRPTETTYRWHTRRLLRDVPWAYVGIELVLGNRADEPITGWQEMFIPMKLRSHLGALTVERDGTEVPLVQEERLLLPTDRGPVPNAPPFRLPAFLAVGLVWAGLVLLLGRTAAGGAWLPRAGLVLAAGTWSVFAALAGLVLLGAWAFTDHVFWAWNENVLQVDPLSAGVAVGLVVLLFRPRLPRWALRLATVVAAVSLLGVGVQILPGFDQVNGEILAAAVPVNLAVAVAARWLAPGGATGDGPGIPAAAAAD